MPGKGESKMNTLTVKGIALVDAEALAFSGLPALGPCSLTYFRR